MSYSYGSALVALAVSTSAHADYVNEYVHAELGVGARLVQAPDGRWQQQAMPVNNVQRLNVAFSIGLTGPLIERGKWGIDWHAGYVNLGRAAADCLCTPDDGNYDPKRHVFQPKNNVPNAFFSGSGSSQGLALTLEPYRWWEGLRWSMEAGAYIHYDSWSEDVAGWQLWGNTPQTLHVSTSYWSVAPVVGLGIGNGRFTLAYRHYFTGLNSKNRDIPPLWNDADVLEVRIKF